MADTDKRMPPVGPIGKNLIDAVEELRQVRGLSLRKLAAELERIGRPIPTLGLSRMAHGDRRMDADDVVALALVLGVNPSALLAPRHIGPDGVVELTPEVRQRASLVWAWLDGRMPLPAEMAEPGSAAEADPPSEQYADFQRYARPDTAASQFDPAFGDAFNLAVRIDLALRDFGNPDTWLHLRDDMIRAYRRAGFAIEELVAEGDRQVQARGPFNVDTGTAMVHLRTAAESVRVPVTGYTQMAPSPSNQPPPVPEPGPHGASTSRVTDPFGERDQ